MTTKIKLILKLMEHFSPDEILFDVLNIPASDLAYNELYKMTDAELRDLCNENDLNHECEFCKDKGYVEVTHDDGQYIEACGECDYFGIIGDVDAKARDKAKTDGFKLTKTGKIKGA